MPREAQGHAAVAVGSSSSNRWTHSARTAAMHSPPQLEPIALFCDYLEHRVATKNMALLRRIASDLFVGRDQTLQEFVELGVNLVAVFPFEELDPTKRAAAAQILFQQQQQRHSSSYRSSPGAGASGHSTTAHSIALAFLEARVQTKNMPWLKCIYSEFCDGREDALRDFLRSGLEAISILPVHIPPPDPSRWLQYGAPHMHTPPPAAAASPIKHRVQMVPAGFATTPSFAFDGRHTRATAAGAGVVPSTLTHAPPQLSPKTPPPRTAAPPQLKTPLSPALHKNRKDSKGLTARPKKRGLATTISEMRKSPKRAYHKRASCSDSTPSPSMKPSRDDGEVAPEHARCLDNNNGATPDAASAAHDQSDRDMAVIRAEFFRIEATEPWRHVFHDHLSLPPPILRFANLTDTLQQFFVRHGRAVWERRFWLPLSRTRDVVLSLQRTKRQQSAIKIYIRRVIKIAYKVLGAAFFVALDARSTQYDGWWYRVPVIDLGTLYRAKGLAHTLAYLREQHMMRFPDVKAKVSTKARGYHSWSASMWSSDAMVTHILQHIRVLKGKADGKGFVLPSNDDDEDSDGDDDGIEDVDEGARDVDSDGEQDKDDDDSAVKNSTSLNEVVSVVNDGKVDDDDEQKNDSDDDDGETVLLAQ